MTYLRTYGINDSIKTTFIPILHVKNGIHPSMTTAIRNVNYNIINIGPY